MPGSRSYALGWQPDLADPRDFTVRHERVVAWMRRLKIRTRPQRAAPSAVDWREYCGPIEDQGAWPTSSAHAVAALVQQFERRSSGRLTRPARLFVHATAARLRAAPLDADVSLRWALKALGRCGLPPERYWPYDDAHWTAEPDALAHSFQRESRNIRYLRIDGRRSSGAQVLEQVKAFLAAGFFLACGFPVTNAAAGEAEIPFPVAADTIVGGQAVTAVGYDDKRRIRSDKGALLIRNSWGPQWGDAGYGWLPYSYVSERLAVDFWTLLKPSWLRSGEFELPE